MQGQEAGGGVGLAGVHEVDALGDPFRLATVVHDAEVRPDLRHARDGTGVQIVQQRNAVDGESVSCHRNHILKHK